MNIVVTGRNVEVTPPLRKYAEEKIGKFDKYLSNISEAVVTLSVQKRRHVVDVLIKANGVLLQAEGETEELYSAIDDVVTKLDKQVKKLKDKLKHKRKGEARASRAEERSRVEPPPAETGVIIERKQYAIKPMPPEEAAMHLEMREGSFFVFTNSESEAVNVIYRRTDGNFGLIEPAG
jgi:putative sigma-54 modulation protein